MSKAAKKITTKPKLSRAGRAAIVAFRGLSPTDEELVLEELGLMVDPVARAAATERERKESDALIAATASPWNLSDFEPGTGEPSFGLPHPDLMSEEQRATYYPKGSRIDDPLLMMKIAKPRRPGRTG